MSTAQTADENEIIRGMEQHTIGVMSQQASVRIHPER
jgi:hypothetical protein